MATVYIAPTAQGSADGTSAANAYAYSSLSSAETDAGAGGTILFTDGTYTFSATQTWDAGGFGDMTYKSENDNGAYLLGSSSIRSLTYGSATTNSVKIEGFKSGNIFFQGNHLQTTALTLTKINHADTISGTRNNRAVIHTGSATNVCAVSDSSFTVDYSGSDRLFQSLTNSTISRCSFYLKCTSVGTGGITNSGSAPTSSNTIFMSDNSNAIADSVVDPSVCTNCCIYQMHANDSSGGTNNVFSDPLFVDTTTGDLRLRPGSPCINAGTA